MQIEYFWQGRHKASKRSYFHCGLSSRASPKSTKKEKVYWNLVLLWNKIAIIIMINNDNDK